MSILFLSAGVFIGNWLIVPILTKRTFKDGFFIGLIAAVICFIFGLILI
jgi:hypothetical protein